MKIFNCFKIVTTIVSLFFIINGCKTKSDEIKEETEIKKINEEILLSENSVLYKKLKLEKVKKEYLNSELSVNGVIRAIPNQFAQISSPFPGRIKKSFISLGKNVRKNDPIFELSSSDYLQSQQEYYSAQQELAQAKINLKRQKDLMAHSVGIQKELEEAQTDYNIKKIVVNQLSEALKVFNSSSKNKMGQSLIVRSPISGKIIQNNIIIGQYLKEDTEPLVTVAELSKVWISAQIKENNLGILNNLKNIKFSINAFPNQTFDGKVINIGQLLNEDTRSVDVIIEADNSQYILKPGMFVNVRLNDASSKEEIVLPTKAIFQDQDNQYVFLSIGSRKFKKTKVKTITNTNNSEFVYVASGLKEGDNVVVDGGIYLMSAK